MEEELEGSECRKCHEPRPLRAHHCSICGILNFEKALSRMMLSAQDGSRPAPIRAHAEATDNETWTSWQVFHDGAMSPRIIR